jgi:hypothetical protein
MNTDYEGAVINGPETYKRLAALRTMSLAFNWTDGRGTLVAAMVTPGSAVTVFANQRLQGFHQALSVNQILFISVLRAGSFGFDLYDGHGVAASYVAEKLGLYGATAKAMAHLINGVKASATGKPHETPKEEEFE